MQTGLDAFRATGSAIVVPFFQTMLAELLGRAGRKPEALELLRLAQAQVEEWDERWQESEIHRVRGDVLLTDPDPDAAAAERSLRLAMDTATAQRAPGWTLRATLVAGAPAARARARRGGARPPGARARVVSGGVRHRRPARRAGVPAQPAAACLTIRARFAGSKNSVTGTVCANTPK